MTIDQMILLYLLLLPINISIAAYSFEYYAVMSKEPLKAISNFDKNMKFPMSFLFKEHRSLTFRLFANSRGANFDNHILRISLREIRLPRRLLILFSGLTIFAPIIGFFSLADISLKIAYIIYVVIYLMTLIFCIKFGRVMLSID